MFNEYSYVAYCDGIRIKYGAESLRTHDEIDVVRHIKRNLIRATRLPYGRQHSVSLNLFDKSVAVLQTNKRNS